MLVLLHLFFVKDGPGGCAMPVFQLLHFVSSDLTEDSEDCVDLVSCTLCDHRAIHAALLVRAHSCARQCVDSSRFTVHGVCAQKAKQVLCNFDVVRK